jgi:hypothetical protein
MHPSFSQVVKKKQMEIVLIRQVEDKVRVEFYLGANGGKWALNNLRLTFVVLACAGAGSVWNGPFPFGPPF